MEIELKLRLHEPTTPETIAAVDLAPYELGPIAVHDLDDRLFDTPDEALARRGQALRLRREGNRLTMTFKGPPQGAGHVHQREEVELEVPTAPTSIADWPAEIRDALDGIDLAALTEVVAVSNHRVAWEVRKEGETVAELVLDDGAVVVGAVRERFHEVEVELRRAGTPADLQEIESRLAAVLDVTPEPRTKLERALALRRRLAVPGGQRLEALGARSLRKNLDKLREAVGVAREGRDPEGVHDLRVATRRLRTALQILGEAGVLPKRLARHRRALRSLARAAAAVRDADVQLLAFARDEAPAELVLAVEQQRLRGRAELLAALDSEETAVALTRLDRDIARLRERGEMPPPEDGTPSLARHFAGSLLWRRYEAVLAFETALAVADPATLHQLRIAIKRLRYAIEFFSDALGTEAKRLRSLLAEFQELFGAYQDSSVAIALARSLFPPGSESPSIRAFMEQRAVSASRLAEQIQSRWQELGGPVFRKLLGEALAPASAEQLR